jgi:hypothetical protein
MVWCQLRHTITLVQVLEMERAGLIKKKMNGKRCWLILTAHVDAL